MNCIKYFHFNNLISNTHDFHLHSQYTCQNVDCKKLCIHFVGCKILIIMLIFKLVANSYSYTNSQYSKEKQSIKSKTSSLVLILIKSININIHNESQNKSMTTNTHKV